MGSQERRRKARERFAAIVARDETELDLAGAALMIAEEQYDDLDLGATLAALDQVADNARDEVWGAGHGDEQVRALARHLGGPEHFRGNVDDYYDARNSYLNDVLERRLGIPITLAVVYIEVGRRLGVKVEGVAFPAHFLVRGPEGALFDPFARGMELDDGALHALAVRVGAPLALRLRRDTLPGAGKKAILFRMLHNLRAIYQRDRDTARLLGAMDRQLALVPEAAELYRDRGLLLAQAGSPGRAAADLEHYAELRPAAADAGEARRVATRLRATLLN
ncbi:MAG TPA: tetratricopeptide repeat protein [Myxococcota bacterium]|jgi:regulator of sirC expression with transglutaminase-like and TPR domain|nr:tetratricopeptide repeat protein [Myxococcota bacterium]